MTHSQTMYHGGKVVGFSLPPDDQRCVVQTKTSYRGERCPFRWRWKLPDGQLICGMHAKGQRDKVEAVCIGACPVHCHG